MMHPTPVRPAPGLPILTKPVEEVSTAPSRSRSRSHSKRVVSKEYVGESDEEEKDRKGKNKAQELDEEDYSEVRQRKGKAREVYEEMEVDTVMGEEATKELPSQRVKPPSASTIRIKPLATRVEESMQVDEDPEVKQEVPTTCTPCATRNLQCVLLIGHYACAFCSHRKLKCDRVPQRWRRVSKKERIEINSPEAATTRRATARK